MRARRMPWWGWALIWAAASIPVAVVIGRAARLADRIEQPRSVGLPGLADLEAEADRRADALWLTRRPHDGPPFPRMPDRIDPSLAGAILTLAYCTDYTSARFWLAECARRGADWDLQRQLWDGWQREHARDVTTLHTDPEDDL